MGAVGSYSGGSTLHGPFHLFQGWFVAQGAILVLFLVNWGVAKLPCGSRVRLYERWKRPAADVVPLTGSRAPQELSALLLLSLPGSWVLTSAGLVRCPGSHPRPLFLVLAYWAVTKLPGNSRVRLHEQWKGLTADVVAPPTLSLEPQDHLRCSHSHCWFLGCYLQFFASPQPVPLKQPLADLPRVIDRWHAQDSAWIEGTPLLPRGSRQKLIRTYQDRRKRDLPLSSAISPLSAKESR